VLPESKCDVLIDHDYPLNEWELLEKIKKVYPLKLKDLLISEESTVIRVPNELIAFLLLHILKEEKHPRIFNFNGDADISTS